MARRARDDKKRARQERRGETRTVRMVKTARDDDIEVL